MAEPVRKNKRPLSVVDDEIEIIDEPSEQDETPVISGTADKHEARLKRWHTIYFYLHKFSGRLSQEFVRSLFLWHFSEKESDSVDTTKTLSGQVIASVPRTGNALTKHVAVLKYYDQLPENVRKEFIKSFEQLAEQHSQQDMMWVLPIQDKATTSKLVDVTSSSKFLDENNLTIKLPRVTYKETSSDMIDVVVNFTGLLIAPKNNSEEFIAASVFSGKGALISLDGITKVIKNGLSYYKPKRNVIHFVKIQKSGNNTFSLYLHLFHKDGRFKDEVSMFFIPLLETQKIKS